MQNVSPSISYLGYEKVTLWESYKCKRGWKYILKVQVKMNDDRSEQCKAQGENQNQNEDWISANVKRIGIVFSNDEWRTHRWFFGSEEKKQGDPMPDPMEEMIKKKQYSPEQEEEWFYCSDQHGKIDSKGYGEFIFFRENDFPYCTKDVHFFENGERMNMPGDHFCFAVFVESMNGHQVWDNNSGMNYDLSTKRISLQNRGWRGT